MKQTFFISLIAALFAVSCGGNAPKTEEQSTKKEHEKIVNYVDTVVIDRKEFKSELISNGRLRARHKSDLSFRGSGYVVELNAINGQSVERGSIIARLNDEETALRLKQAQQTMNKAQLDLQDALLGFGYTAKDTTNIPKETMRIARIRSGYESAESSLEVAKLECAGRVIRAPFSGRIANLKTKLHENPKGDFFCSVIDDGSFDIDFTVLEGEVGKLHEAMNITAATFNDPTIKYRGSIKGINPTVDQKGQVTVTATINNTSGKLMDGMNVKVFVENRIPNKLVVPKSAVVIRDNLDVLFTMDAQGKAHWVYVWIEASNSTHHAVTANTDRGAKLEPLDAVITTGNLNLADMVDVELRKK